MSKNILQEDQQKNSFFQYMKILEDLIDEEMQERIEKDKIFFENKNLTNEYKT